MFIPDFTVAGGFEDRKTLYFVCVSFVCRQNNPTSARVYFGGIVGCTVGQICPKIPHIHVLEPIEYRKYHNSTHMTTTSTHDAGQRPPRPLPQPFPSGVRSGSMRLFTTSWVMPGMLGFLYVALGAELQHFFY